MVGELGAADGRQALHCHRRCGQGGWCRAQVRDPPLPPPALGELGKLLGFGPKPLCFHPHLGCLVGYSAMWVLAGETEARQCTAWTVGLGGTEGG